MAGESKYIDISHMPELLRLAEEVRTSGEPRVLTRDRQDLAVLIPVKSRRIRRPKTPADYEAFRSAAGGWKGLIDTETFIEENYESRRLSSRPPVEL